MTADNARNGYTVSRHNDSEDTAGEWYQLHAADGTPVGTPAHSEAEAWANVPAPARTLNQQIAEALGWSGFEEREWWVEDFDDTYKVKGIVAMRPGGSELRPLPDYEHDFNAFLDVIDGRDLVVKFQPDLPITVTIYDTGYSLEYGKEKAFVAGAHENGEADTTVQRAAARALLLWLQFEEHS